MTADSDTIEECERRFWQALVDKDADAAAAMVARDCLITGPMGAAKIDPDKYRQMASSHDWSITSFAFSDVSVITPAEDVAVIAYKVEQKGEMKGTPMDMTCADSSTWVREGGSWKCALHTETVLKG